MRWKKWAISHWEQKTEKYIFKKRMRKCKKQSSHMLIILMSLYFHNRDVAFVHFPAAPFAIFFFSAPSFEQETFWGPLIEWTNRFDNNLPESTSWLDSTAKLMPVVFSTASAKRSYFKCKVLTACCKQASQWSILK